MMIVGTPEQCSERLGRYADLGVGDFLLGALTPIDPQTIELVAGSVAPAHSSRPERRRKVAIGSSGADGWRVVRHWFSHAPSIRLALAPARTRPRRASPASI